MSETSSISKESERNSTSSGEEVIENNEDKKDREGFANGLEFLLSCLGMAVGLGNIWRFPTRAYENGGSAFLIPYITCAFLLGLPTMYFEFTAGQYQGKSSPIIFRRIMPILEGVGWMGVVVSSCVSVYYIVLVSWISIYIINIFRGHINIWNKCDNEWNEKETCIDMLQQKICRDEQGANMSLIYIDGGCQNAEEYRNVTFVSATEQYFRNYILNPSSGFLDISSFNIPFLISMTICWILTCLLILKGMKMIGKISYVTVILPYVIVFILFLRGITLDGASEGLTYYLGKPDWSKIYSIKTWSEAFKQLFFSLGVGFGCMISLASYNQKNHNCFKNALIVICADTTMSLIGGMAVFSTLGFLAKLRGVTVPEVVQSGLSLTFVVYPEAMTQMPISWLWAFLFFFMLFLLGLSSEMAMTEVFCTCLCDRFESLRKHKTAVSITWCVVLYLFGIIFATDAGIYWFEMYDEYASGFSSVFAVTIEILVLMYAYGGNHFRADIAEMIGQAKNQFTALFGPLSPYFLWNWRIITPVCSFALCSLSFFRTYPYMDQPEVYPVLFDIIGWFMAFLPVFMIPIFAIINWIEFKNRGLDSRGLFMIQKQHLSYNRISKNFSSQRMLKQEILPDNEPFETNPKEGDRDETDAGSTPLSEQVTLSI